MKIEPRPSPNWNARPAGVVVDCVVIHADADADVDASLAYCCDARSKVSYHTLIGRTGRIFSLVAAEKRAWHAGVSAFQGRANVNDFSVGLSFGNRNDGVERYTDAQYAAGALYVASLMAAFPYITLDRITTHAAIALPAGRKTDPGPCFDMAGFVDRIRSLRPSRLEPGVRR